MGTREPTVPRSSVAGALPVRSKPTVILFANHSGQMSGAEHSLLALLRAIQGRPLRPVCACPAGSPLADALSAAGCESVPAAFRRLYRTGNPLRLARYAASQAGLAWALRGAVRRAGAELVHSNSTTAHVAAGLAAKLAGVPAVWHVRDLVDLGLMGHGLARTADRIVAISRAVARSLDRCAGRDKVEVVHNGIVVEIDDPQFGRTRQMGIPIAFTDSPGVVRGPAPALGQHTRQVLAELGCSDPDIERLAEQDAIFCSGGD